MERDVRLRGRVPCVSGVERVLDREHLFGGNALNAVDAKNRVSLPSWARQKIERRSHDKAVVIGFHPDFDCLVGYDTNHSRVMLSKGETALADNDDPFALLDMQTAVMGDILEIPYDTSGRIILPQRYKDGAKIGDLALFLGTGDEFLIWSPQVAMKSPSARLSKLASDLIAARKGAA